MYLNIGLVAGRGQHAAHCGIQRSAAAWEEARILAMA